MHDGPVITIQELSEKAEHLPALIEQMSDPIAIAHNGKTLAYLVPANGFVQGDMNLTLEDLEAIHEANLKGLAEIKAGRGIRWEDAKARLEQILRDRGDV